MPDDGARDAWEGRAAAVLMGAAGVVFCVAVSFWVRGGGAPAWRLAGLLLELLGLLLGVWIRTWKWIEATGARTPDEWVRDLGRRARRGLRRTGRALRRRWRRVLVGLGWAEEEPESQSTGAPVAGVEAEAPTPSVAQGPPPERDLEERVERLEGRVEHLQGEIADVRKEASRRAEELAGRLEAVGDDLREADRRLRDELEEQIREAAVGSLRWEYVALAWFVLGVLATTWAGVLPEPPVPG